MVLDLLVIGLIITLYPLPIMAFVLVVSAPGGLWKGLAFILAWLGCLVAVIAVVLLLTGGQPPPPRSPPSTAGLAVRLAIGIGLVAYAEHRRRRRPAAGDAAPDAEGSGSADEPRALSRVDRVSAWSAAGIAVLLQPWGMVGAAAATVLEANLSDSATYLALFGFCILASSTLLAMELFMVFAPGRAALALTGMRSWLSDHKDPAIVLACLVLGLWLVGRSLYDLTR
ncbi:GAP family protein [Streptomyces erythrochromogenes]|uniref:GAP family protein n=1 Tax=Streptomyces erythrochromogenes TaxID=285574 RepID=UPI0038309BB1|nr:GAP family protein [Streptomyces erythrochromogenes]